MSESIQDVAVVGAGISGLAAAKRLQKEGKSVVVVEGGTCVGGRAASGTIAWSNIAEIPIDYGAQSFTVHSRRFQEQVNRWQEEKICFPLSDGLWRWSKDGLRPPHPYERRIHYACRGGMCQLAKNLAKRVSVVVEYQVDRIEFNKKIWHIHARTDHHESPILARNLFLSVPVPEAVKLMGKNHFSRADHEFMGRVTYVPTITIVAIYPEGIIRPPWHGIDLNGASDNIFRISWNSCQRVKGSLGAVAVIHATTAVSTFKSEPSGEELTKEGMNILSEAAQWVGEWLQEPVDFAVHYWRHGRSQGPRALRGFLKGVQTNQLYLVGDGLNGGQIEGAWLSGLFAAEDFLSGNQQ